MLYHFLYPLKDAHPIFNVFRYITFRATYATLSAILLSFILGPWLIRKLQRFPAGETIRDYVPTGNEQKAETPTMGGSLILIAIVFPTLLWANLDNHFIWTVLLVTVGMGAIGFFDDYLKLHRKSHDGLNRRQKFLGQLLVASMASVFIYFVTPSVNMSVLPVPFFKQFKPDLGYFYIPFAVMVITGTSNAVNLTDGLDGLAVGPMIIATITFMLLAYLAGHAKFSKYLMIVSVPGAGELAVFCGAMLGAGLGFLWFNSYPAQVFMGDMGALALGGALGTIAVIIKQELLLIIVGGVFVIEALSVIIQVFSYQTVGKRVFHMAPLHHHFEKRGWLEPKIVVRFWIIAVMLALFSLSTLKLR